MKTAIDVVKCKEKDKIRYYQVSNSCIHEKSLL